MHRSYDALVIGAVAAGMTGPHHTSVDATLAELDVLPGAPPAV